MNRLRIYTPIFRSTIVKPAVFRPYAFIVSRGIHTTGKLFQMQHQQQPSVPDQSSIEKQREWVDRLAREREERQKYRNRTATYYTASLGIFFLALAFSAVPIYRAICQRTGWG